MAHRGQVRGLQRQVESDTYCIDMLTQVSAATRALQAFALRLLDEHLSHCVASAVAEGGAEADAKVAEATAAIARLVRGLSEFRCNWTLASSVGGRWGEAAFEGDREGVQGRFPSHGPSCPSAAGGVEGSGDEVEALQRGLFGREVSAGLDRPAVAAFRLSIAVVEQMRRRISTGPVSVPV